MVGRVILVALITLSLFLGLTFVGVRSLQHRKALEEAAKLKKREDISITIIEGKRREEIAAQLAQAGITTYSAFMAASEGKEGRLFPDTYRFFPNTDPPVVVGALTRTFETKAGFLQPTPEQLILASIIEREARNDAERAAISGVYHNRLRISMKLDADPTVQYGKDSLALAQATNPESFTFWGTITRADYRDVISPYNTYLTNSLPPTPICNPGRKSIEAAMNPATHEYFYFAHRNGELLLSKTLAEHERKLRSAQR
jgi:UPF0755 protein